MPLIRVGVLCLSIATMACFPSRFFPCQVVILDQPEIYTVLSRYRWSYFDTSCRPSTPKELLIRRESYSVYVLLRSDHPAKVYLGLRPLHSARFELSGPHLWMVGQGSAFRDVATHMSNTESLRDQLSFRVLERETGNVESFSFMTGVAQCTCKGYDGP